MTSGNFSLISVASIKVNRANRQRQEIGDVDDLANSISRLGLIHPIVVDREFNLVAGERRLMAYRSLGLDSIAVQWADELSAIDRMAIELEENVKRRDITWQDQCRSIQKYHEFRKDASLGWSQGDTAQELGFDTSSIQRFLAVGEQLSAGNAAVAAAPKFSVARGIVERQKSRQDAETVRTIRAIAGAPPSKPEDLPVESILVVDFLEWSKTYDGPRFNFLHCDFPYGIGASEFNQGGAAAYGGYRDGFSDYVALLESLIENIDRFLTESAHLVFWFSMQHYSYTLNALSALPGFTIEEYPLIWTKSDNAGISPRPHHGPRRIYETAFFGWRGDRRVVKTLGNAYVAPSQQGLHMSIKPQPMLQHFMSMVVDGNTLMLDPTAGSGSALRAAESLGARYVLGLERDPEFAKLANEELNKQRRLRRATA